MIADGLWTDRAGRQPRIYSPRKPRERRVERANRTLQDRLVKELRLRSKSPMEEANWYLPDYIADHNRRFAGKAEDPIDAHRSGHNLDLDDLLTYSVECKVFKYLSISFNKIRYFLENNETNRKSIGKRVSVVPRLDGHIDILLGETALLYHHTRSPDFGAGA